MTTFLDLVDRLSENIGRLCSYIIIPLILTVVYSVYSRYYLGLSVHWAFEISIFFYAVPIMLGGAYTLKHDAHVKVDVISGYLGIRTRSALDILSLTIVLSVCCVIIYIGSVSAINSTIRLERSAMQTPFNPQIWWFRWIIPISAFLIALQALVGIVRISRFLSQDKTRKK